MLLATRRRLWKWGACLLFLVAFLARARFCSEDVFLYDSADYMRAIHAGFWPQYTGADSMSVTAFLDLYRKDSQFREHPWGVIYQQNDGAALRHFHVPVGFYLPALADGIGWGRKAQRLLIAGISSLTVLIVFLILLSSGVAEWIALLAGLLLSISPVLVLAGTALSPHALFSATAMVCVFSLCRWLETGFNFWVGVFVIALGISIGTLELTPLLGLVIAAVLVSSWWQRRVSANPLLVRKAIGAIVAGLVIAILLWPGGLLRGGYAMSYGVFVFQGLFRSALYFQQRSFPSSVYRLGLGWAMGISLGVILTVGVYAALRVRGSVLLGGFALFSTLLFVQGVANGFRNPTYASHAVFAIVLTGALAAHFLLGGERADRWVGRVTLALLGVMTAGQAIALVRTSPAQVGRDSIRVAGAIAELRAKFAAGTQFVVTEDPQAFITNAPEFRFASAASVTSTAPEPWIHLDRYYLLFDRDAAALPRGIAFCDPGRLKDYGFAVSCATL